MKLPRFEIPLRLWLMLERESAADASTVRTQDRAAGGRAAQDTRKGAAPRELPPLASIFL
jgi:hypothetical protein